MATSLIAVVVLGSVTGLIWPIGAVFLVVLACKYAERGEYRELSRTKRNTRRNRKVASEALVYHAPLPSQKPRRRLTSAAADGYEGPKLGSSFPSAPKPPTFRASKDDLSLPAVDQHATNVYAVNVHALRDGIGDSREALDGSVESTGPDSLDRLFSISGESRQGVKAAPVVRVNTSFGRRFGSVS